MRVKVARRQRDFILRPAVVLVHCPQPWEVMTAADMNARPCTVGDAPYREDAVERTLSYDEQKAAEAAFRGLPCNPHWSASARAVYDGIVKAMVAAESAPATVTEEVLQS
jgi:hypothetical protein